MNEDEFDQQFVKDLGPDVEPVFIDPNGSVGPIKAYIRKVESEAYTRGLETAHQIDAGIAENEYQRGRKEVVAKIIDDMETTTAFAGRGIGEYLGENYLN